MPVRRGANRSHQEASWTTRADRPGAMKLEMGKFDADLKKLDSIQ